MVRDPARRALFQSLAVIVTVATLGLSAGGSIYHKHAEHANRRELVTRENFPGGAESWKMSCITTCGNFFFSNFNTAFLVLYENPPCLYNKSYYLENSVTFLAMDGEVDTVAS